MTALILAAHGSHLSPDTAGIVWSYVDQLRQWGIADEITACFWKETPSFNQVLDTVESDEIVVVPVFTATGYFSQTVIPAAMGLAGPITHCGGRTIYYTRPIGEHPYLNQIVQQRVTDVIQREKLNIEEVAVAVIGHGTPRNAQSQDAARQQVLNLSQEFAIKEIVSVYLDDEPTIASVYETTHSPTIIAVPFFIAPGSHVTNDVPQALGLISGETYAMIKGRQVYYTPPVGTDEVICDVILDLAGETGLPFNFNHTENIWTGFPKRGWHELHEAANESGTLQFGQLEVSGSEIRHSSGGGRDRSIQEPGILRKLTRENPFRPLSTTRDLPTGWRIPLSTPDQMGAVVETVYPGAIADWALNRQGCFRADTLAEVGKRQTGMFRSIQALEPKNIEAHILSICGKCVRHPTWYFRKTEQNEIPCKSPCNMWLSTVMETK